LIETGSVLTAGTLVAMVI